MGVTGLGWVGTRTDRAAELSKFYEDVLGPRVVYREEGFWVHELPDGRHVEVFGPTFRDKSHFVTGPVVGFEVDDLAGAVNELRGAGRPLGAARRDCHRGH